jgi:hypothetical protein
MCIYPLAADKPLFKNIALIRALTIFASVFNKIVRLAAEWISNSEISG